MLKVYVHQVLLHIINSPSEAMYAKVVTHLTNNIVYVFFFTTKGTYPLR